MSFTTMDEFDKASAPLIGNFGREWWDEIARELWNRYSWMNPEDWERVVKRLNDTCNYKPRISKFVEAVKFIDVNREHSGCSMCDNKRGRAVFYRYETWVRDEKKTVRTTAWLPCSVCSMPKIRDDMGWEVFDKRNEWWQETFTEITQEGYLAEAKPKDVATMIPDDEIPF